MNGFRLIRAFEERAGLKFAGPGSLDAYHPCTFAYFQGPSSQDPNDFELSVSLQDLWGMQLLEDAGYTLPAPLKGAIQYFLDTGELEPLVNRPEQGL